MAAEMPDASRSDPFRGRAWRWSALAVLTVLVWVQHVEPPRQVPGPRTGASWPAALFHVDQAGVDYVFTYGPLGKFFTAAYDSDHYGLKLVAWEGVFKLCLAGILTLAGLRIRSWLGIGLYFLVLLVHPPYPDAYVLACIFAATTVGVVHADRRPALAHFALVVLAVFPLVKFTFALPSALGALAIVAARGRASMRKESAFLALTFPGAFVALWLLAGQRLGNVPEYLRQSFRLSSGYSEGMSTDGRPALRELALVLVVLIILLAAIHVRDGPRARSRRLISLALLPMLWIAYKAGFVRATTHPPNFLVFTLIVPFLLVDGDGPRGIHVWLQGAARLACIVLSLVGLQIALGFQGWGLPAHLAVSAVRTAKRSFLLGLDPVAHRSMCDARYAEAARQASLPRTREAVGRSSIDFISVQQGILFLNGLSWRPRPVFQGYATFGPELMELNATFLRGERASEFVLFHLETLDQRLPTMDDALALQVIVRDYAPVLIERDYLLLHREPRGGIDDPPRPVLAREIAFGERLELGELKSPCHLLDLDIRYAAVGRIRTLIDRAPPLLAEFELDTGGIARFRIVPGMMKAGVILDPFMRTQDDWLAWFGGGRLPRPTALRILPPESPSMYEARIGVTLLAADALTPRTRADLWASYAYSPFETAPDEVRSEPPPRHARAGNVEVLVLEPPSRMLFHVDAGAHVLEGSFGFLTGAWLGIGTEGASFGVRLRAADGSERVLLEQVLDPVRREIDRPLQPLRVEFETESAADLLLCIDSARSGDPATPRIPRRDWTCWTAISIR